MCATNYLCSGLTSVAIPSSVTSIGRSVFQECSGLTSVEMGESVTSIGNYAFKSCTGLTSVVIPSSVTSIGENAFESCTGLTSVVIPSSVTSIGYAAFYLCSGLTRVVIPSSVTSIGASAFYSCTGLTSVILPDSVTSIGDYAFRGCKRLTSMTIPASVTKIGQSAFSECYFLKTLVCKAQNPCSIKSKFDNVQTLYVPASSVDAYKAADYWKYIPNILPINSLVWKEGSVLKADGDFSQEVFDDFMADNDGLDGINAIDLLNAVIENDINAEDVMKEFGNNVFMYVPSSAHDGFRHHNNVVVKDTSGNFNCEKAVITDGVLFAPPYAFSATNVEYKRTFNNTNWQALYLPYSLNYDDWKDDFEVARLNDIHQYDTDDDGEFDYTVLEIAKVKSGSTKADTPYLIYAKQAGEKTITTSNVSALANSTPEAFTCSSFSTLYTFTGNLSPIDGTTMYDNGYYAMGGGSLIMAEDASASLAALRWYMTATDRSGGTANAPRRIIIANEGGPTGIAEIDAPKSSADIYDLQGRKMNGNQHSGIYVRNGKKVFIK